MLTTGFMGAEHAYRGRHRGLHPGDPVEQIMDLTGGEGVDAAIEAFGFPQTF